MNFRKTTDKLLESITLEDLATTLGVSVQAVRQARASEGTASHRRPPSGWEAAAAWLAKCRARELEELGADLLKSSRGRLAYKYTQKKSIKSNT
jgi:hypothetical protein